MSGGRSSSDSPHVYRGGFKLPKHLKSPLHLPEGEDQSAFGIGHASPLLHKSPSMTGLGCYNDGTMDSATDCRQCIVERHTLVGEVASAWCSRRFSFPCIHDAAIFSQALHAVCRDNRSFSSYAHSMYMCSAVLHSTGWWKRFSSSGLLRARNQGLKARGGLRLAATTVYDDGWLRSLHVVSCHNQARLVGDIDNQPANLASQNHGTTLITLRCYPSHPRHSWIAPL